MPLLFWRSQGYVGIGRTNNGLTEAERVYADHFLNAGSGNHPPPAQNPYDPAYVSNRDYRQYQRLQAYYEVVNGAIQQQTIGYIQQFSTAGVSPEPCSGLRLYSLPVERNPLDGTGGLTSDGLLVYQVNEARVGQDGQAINQFLNGTAGADPSTATPWIWDVIQFDANGKTRAWIQGDNSNNLQIFPTYQIYTNGFALPPNPEGDLMTFIGLTSTSQYNGPQR